MRYAIAYFILLLALTGTSQDSSSAYPESKLYLITCDPGDELYSNFGHSALRWQDPMLKVDVVFNYGTFDFSAPGFYQKFLRGKLPYRLAAAPYGAFLQEYHEEKRSVFEQELILPKTQIDSIIEFLKYNALPENREYKYDFFFDNCSTRIRDVVSKSTNEELSLEEINPNTTYRDLLHQYLVGKPWIRMGIDLIIGSPADHVANVSHQMFLPDLLMGNLSKAKWQRQPILSKPYQVLMYEREKIERKKAGILTPTLVFLILLFLSQVARKYHPKSYGILKSTIYALSGIGGLIIAFLWFGTDHLATKTNYNLFWLSPLFLGMIFPIKSKKSLAAFLLIMIVLALVFHTLSILQCMPFMEIYILLALLLITDIWPHYFTDNPS